MLKSIVNAACVWCVVVTLFACAPNAAEPTQALIWIRADARVAASLAQLRLALYPASQTGGDRALRTATFDVATDKPRPGELSLPFSFSILKGTSDLLELVITGHANRSADAAAVIEHRSIIHFEALRSIEFTVLLSEACFNRARDCAALDQTCAPRDGDRVVAGECVPVADATRSSDDVTSDDRRPSDRTALQTCEFLDDEICDPIADCGCRDGRHCQLAEGSTRCGEIGVTPGHKSCRGNADCSNGLSCDAGVCRAACIEQADCATGDGDQPGAVCVRRQGHTHGTCWQICGEPESEPCPGEQSCSPVRFSEESPPATLCIAVEDPCTRTDDGVCDEPTRGTGFCAAHTDQRDCCDLPEPHGDCDWFTQCGCAQGRSCQIDDVVGATVFVKCQPTGDRPLGSVCDVPAQCVKGAGCYGQICKAMCRSDDDCPSGPCVHVWFNGRQAEEAGSCETACDFDSGLPCGPGTVCARQPSGSFCFRTLTSCPPQFIGDNVCHEDTRVCAPDTDPDCVR